MMLSLHLLGQSVLLIAFASVCQCANILYLSTLPSPSHNLWDKTLAMGLVERNHSITFFTHSPETSSENFTTIIIEGVYEKIAKTFNYVNWQHETTLNSITKFHAWLNWICTQDLESEAIRTLLKQAEKGVKYDLIIMDMTSGQCLYPIIEIFGSPPVIGTSPYGLIQYFTFSFGIDLHIAYNPFNFLPYTDHMSLWDRTQNYFYTMAFLFCRQWSYMPSQQKLAVEFFGKDITPLQEMEKSFSLLLANTDPVFDYPQPVPPAVIQVGGLHTARTKSLPEDLQQYLDNSIHGVIYFSLGSNIRTDHLGTKEISIFLETFSQLKENVLWKCDSELLNTSSNILIRKWLPQNDILAHPKVKLFISHGGALSTQEAMCHGVPILGIPFYADQHVNICKMVTRKLGLKLDNNNITTTNLMSHIHELTENNIYKQNMQIMSTRYKDRPQTALEQAIFWVEYVIRHGGADHLQIAARQMSFYKTWLLDIWGLAILVMLTVVYLIKQVKQPNKRKQKVKRN